VRWRGRMPPRWLGCRPLIGLMALLSLCSGLAAASDVGQHKENSKL
jgi:hypothetical protein